MVSIGVDTTAEDDVSPPPVWQEIQPTIEITPKIDVESIGIQTNFKPIDDVSSLVDEENMSPRTNSNWCHDPFI